MNSTQLLQEARDLYASAPSHVARGSWPDTGTYCVITAIGAVSDRAKLPNTVENRILTQAIKRVKAQVGDVALIDFNAENDTETVLAVFDSAIRS